MRIDVYHHFVGDPKEQFQLHGDVTVTLAGGGNAEAAVERLAGLVVQHFDALRLDLSRLSRQVTAHQRQEERFMTRVSDELAEMETEIAAQTTVQAGVKVLTEQVSGKIDTLFAELEEAQSSGDEVAAQRILTELRERTAALRETSDVLAAAVAKGTPAEEPPVETGTGAGGSGIPPIESPPQPGGGEGVSTSGDGGVPTLPPTDPGEIT